MSGRTLLRWWRAPLWVLALATGAKSFADNPILGSNRLNRRGLLREGWVLAIEPMVNIGRPDCKVLEDGWTAVTRDRSLSAQFEHSVGITETGCEIFTKSPAGLDKPPYF